MKSEYKNKLFVSVCVTLLLASSLSVSEAKKSKSKSSSSSSSSNSRRQQSQKPNSTPSPSSSHADLAKLSYSGYNAPPKQPASNPGYPVQQRAPYPSAPVNQPSPVSNTNQRPIGWNIPSNNQPAKTAPYPVNNQPSYSAPYPNQGAPPAYSPQNNLNTRTNYNQPPPPYQTPNTGYNQQPGYSNYPQQSGGYAPQPAGYPQGQPNYNQPQGGYVQPQQPSFSQPGGYYPRQQQSSGPGILKTALVAAAAGAGGAAIYDALTPDKTKTVVVYNNTAPESAQPAAVPAAPVPAAPQGEFAQGNYPQGNYPMNQPGPYQQPPQNYQPGQPYPQQGTYPMSPDGINYPLSQGPVYPNGQMAPLPGMENMTMTTDNMTMIVNGSAPMDPNAAQIPMTDANGSTLMPPMSGETTIAPIPAQQAISQPNNNMFSDQTLESKSQTKPENSASTGNLSTNSDKNGASLIHYSGLILLVSLISHAVF